MHRYLEPILEQAPTVWRKLHAEASDVVRTFVHGPEQTPDAAVTIMRAWEHGWLAQHFVDSSPELNGATGRLQTAYLDHVVPRPDGRYLLFFIKTDNRVMDAYLGRFFASTGTAEAVSRSVVELWRRPGDAPKSRAVQDNVQIRSLVPADEAMVARAVEQRLGTHAAAALSMVPGELEIPDTRARFAKLGLERGRICQIALFDDVPAYAIVEERSTPGLNLTWMLNASWIFPIHPEIDNDHGVLDAVLESIVDRPAQTQTGDRFLNLPSGFDANHLSEWGFTKEATLHLYALTRAGSHRFLGYTTTRYGELDAMTQRRGRRRGQTDHP
jgi:hypothetical protein